MNRIAVIPARLKSTRLANKVLKPISGKPLLWYTWQRAQKAHSLDKVIIAACDEEVKKAALAFGAEVYMTDPEHTSGTDRIAEVASGIEADIILNIQADEPLIKSETLDKLSNLLNNNPKEVMASLAFSTTNTRDLSDQNAVKVVVDNQNNALYFSRSLIPNNREDTSGVKYMKHIGIYAYRRDFLLKFSQWQPGSLEQVEKLEQLRVLENGMRIKIMEIDYDTIGVDTQEDFKRVEEVLKSE